MAAFKKAYILSFSVYTTTKQHIEIILCVMYVGSSIICKTYPELAGDNATP